MFSFIKNAELAKIQQLMETIQRLDPRREVVVEKKRNYTWLIVLASVIVIAGIAFAVYKYFFEEVEDFEDFDDEDFDDIDYDEDFDEVDQ